MCTQYILSPCVLRDLPWCSLCCGFDRFRRNFFQSTGADDRSKGDGFQTQMSKGCMAGHVWKEELLAKAITSDGRKKWCCHFYSETNVWMRDWDSVSVTSQTRASGVTEEGRRNHQCNSMKRVRRLNQRRTAGWNWTVRQRAVRKSHQRKKDHEPVAGD